MSVEVVQQVLDARADKRQLLITGTGSKRQLLPAAEPGIAQVIATTQGIIDYQPEELVVTVFAGTKISVLAQQLQASNQELAFDPPRFDGTGTVGGMLSCGLSGPGASLACL